MLHLHPASATEIEKWYKQQRIQELTGDANLKGGGGH